MIRAGSTDSLAELDAIERGQHLRFPRVTYLPLTDLALKRAARLWAEARNRGYSTAQDKALDGDVLLAAQILEHAGASTRFTIVTGNVEDLAWYVGKRRARLWVDMPV